MRSVWRVHGYWIEGDSVICFSKERRLEVNESRSRFVVAMEDKCKASKTLMSYCEFLRAHAASNSETKAENNVTSN